MNGTYEFIGKIVFSAVVYIVWTMILGILSNGVSGNLDEGGKFSFLPPWVFGMILFTIWTVSKATL